MMYQAFTIFFIAPVYNIELSLPQQFLILLTLMITSKGIAGVARAAVVVMASSLAMFNIPEAGPLLILGIKHFFDEGRTAINVVGINVATTVITKFEQDEDELESL